MKKETLALAVVRFQGDELHPGWRYLIEHMLKRYKQAGLIIGVAPFPTPRNPLSFEMVRAMVRRAYPKLPVFGIKDHPCNKAWSQNLDALIAREFPNETAVLCGSRNSFIPHYAGMHKTCTLRTRGAWNGTALRDDIAKKPRHTRDFRRGVIYAWKTRLAVTRPMVDIAVIDEYRKLVLLGQKPDDPPELWRFPGGLVDLEDESYESAAKRELREEAPGITAEDYRYVGSSRSTDWRYADTGEGGHTTLFCATYMFGHTRAGDDLARLEWFEFSKLPTVLVPEHAPLGEMLRKSRT